LIVFQLPQKGTNNILPIIQSDPRAILICKEILENTIWYPIQNGLGGRGFLSDQWNEKNSVKQKECADTLFYI
jgi:hypothetical protein